jgi:hypothetical protein
MCIGLQCGYIYIIVKRINFILQKLITIHKNREAGNNIPGNAFAQFALSAQNISRGLPIP